MFNKHLTIASFLITVVVLCNAQTNQIQPTGHLPGIPSAQEVDANGVDLGQMNRKLLEKVEELTLYILKQQDTINQLIEKTAHL